MLSRLLVTSIFIFGISCTGGTPSLTNDTPSISPTPANSFVLGQNSGTSLKHLYFGMNNPNKGCVAGTKLFVADTGNHRILVWNTIPTSNQQPPDFALGQTSLELHFDDFGVPSASTLSMPYAVASDGTHLFVADYGHHRILIWNSIPTQMGQPADLVLGQPNMMSAVQAYDPITINTPNQYNLQYPASVSVFGTKLLVADSMQSRVLIWNTIPTTNMQNADVVVGQPDFTSGFENNDPVLGPNHPTAQTLDYPFAAIIVGTKLIVADNFNNRVLIYSAVPTSNQPVADFVIGQPDLTSNSPNNDPILGPWNISAKTLSQPMDMASDGTKLLVADTTNNRVLVFNSIPAGNQVAADAAIGQADMISSMAAGPDLTAANLNMPTGVWVNNTTVYIGDSSESRVLVFTTVPSSNGTGANQVLGQESFNQNLVNNAGISSTSFNVPQDVATDGSHLFMVDQYNNRVLIWNNLPTTDNVAAELVVGQTSMVSNTKDDGGLVSARSLFYPEGVASDGTHLAIADSGNNRVLIWNSIPTSNYAAANVVLGQPDFTQNAANNSGPNASSMAHPSKLTFCGVKLVVSDFYNHRVLIWNTIPTVSNTSADVVVGQPDFAHTGYNQDPGVGLGTTAANTLAFPTNVTCVGDKLLVSDHNARVLIYDPIPTSNNANATIALGQHDFSTNTTASGTADRITGPRGLYSDGTKLFVSDLWSNRIMIWNTFPTTMGQSADSVFGQTSFASLQTNIVPTLTSTIQPLGLAGTSTMIFVADSTQYRILVIKR
jgi:hypothetical protein